MFHDIHIHIFLMTIFFHCDVLQTLYPKVSLRIPPFSPISRKSKEGDILRYLNLYWFSLINILSCQEIRFRRSGSLVLPWDLCKISFQSYETSSFFQTRKKLVCASSRSKKFHASYIAQKQTKHSNKTSSNLSFDTHLAVSVIKTFGTQALLWHNTGPLPGVLLSH